MKEIILNSEQQKAYCKTWIDEQNSDGSKTVILRNTKTTPTDRQRRLWFLWVREVSISGIGQDDTVDDVHLRAKWKFVRPLLLEQSSLFATIYNHFMETVEYSDTKSELCIEFARDFISTEKLTKENRIKSLKDFQRYWISAGVNLTDPNLRGVDLKNV